MADTFGARAAIAEVAVDFEPFAEPAGVPDHDTDDGPLGWPGYSADRARAREASGERESVLCGTGLVGAQPAVLIAFDFRYVGGSIGRHAGDLICAGFAAARRLRRPVVSLVASGGSRMQEGMHALRQLQRISVECERNRAAGVAHVAVLRQPTAGGGWAAVGAAADVVVATRGASVAFAGRRVRGDVVDTEPFTSDGKLRTGQVDLVVAPGELRRAVAAMVEALAPVAGPPEPAPVPRALGDLDLPADGVAAVRRARAADRPRAAAYLDDYFETRVSISGDRAGGVDPGMLCGFGRRGGRTIAYAAQTGSANTPAGFRTATRLVTLADRLGLPVLTLVDTPGAANDASAEQTGVGPAIAELFGAMARLRVPVTSLVVGEGGSGGAIALTAAQRLWITPDGYFSVIAPQAAAAILKRDAGEVPVLADRLRLRPQDLLADGIVRGIAGPEPIP